MDFRTEDNWRRPGLDDRLARLDARLKRLGWTRVEESTGEYGLVDPSGEVVWRTRGIHGVQTAAQVLEADRRSRGGAR